MRIRAHHYATGEQIEILYERKKIAAIAPASTGPVDREAQWVAPAFFDLQINGCLGHSFNAPDLTIDKIRDVVDMCAAHGIGGFLPTLITNSHESILHGFSVLKNACETDSRIAEAIAGFHLEGPYISSEDGPRGAHPKVHVRRPAWDEFMKWQDASGGRIKLITLAPELDGALAFIERLVKNGIVVAIGHTAASSAQIRDAIKAGARLSTHLGNGSHATLPRHDNYLWEQLAADDLWASIIADGHHLPAALLKCIVRLKMPKRLIITCDASSLAGLPPGKYLQWGSEFEVLENGRIVLPGTPFLAGSGVFTDACVANAVSMAGVSLAEAIEMASSRPRELLGMPEHSLKVGTSTKLMLFDYVDGNLAVKTIIS